MAVTHHQHHTGACGGVDHAGAFVEGQCHGFFNHHMFAIGRSHFNLCGMQLVRRGNVNCLDLGVATKRFEVGVACHTKVARELSAR